MYNCEYCGAPPMFKKGDRVALNAVWHKYSGGDSDFTIGSKATVRGLSRDAGCIRIVFDGQKTPQTFHQSFLNKIRHKSKI